MANPIPGGWQEMKEITLPKNGDSVVTVVVNGVKYQVEAGKPTMVPYPVYERLTEMIEQDNIPPAKFPSSMVKLDKTLTEEGAAADAKAVGDALALPSSLTWDDLGRGEERTFFEFFGNVYCKVSDETPLYPRNEVFLVFSDGMELEIPATKINEDAYAAETFALVALKDNAVVEGDGESVVIPEKGVYLPRFETGMYVSFAVIDGMEFAWDGQVKQINKIPAEYIPEPSGSYTQIYGSSPLSNLNLSWDGNVEWRYTATSEGSGWIYCRISDIVPPVQSVSSASVTRSNGMTQNTIIENNGFYQIGGGAGDAWVVPEAGKIVTNSGITYDVPAPGIYLVQGSGFFAKQIIMTCEIPDSVLYINSLGGKKYAIQVSTAGTVVAKEVNV